MGKLDIVREAEKRKSEGTSRNADVKTLAPTNCELPILLHSDFLLLTSLLPATCGLVSGPSTSAEVSDLFPRMKDRLRTRFCHGRSFMCNLLEFPLHPAHARDFDAAILRNPECSGNIG